MPDICHALQAIAHPQAHDWYAGQARQQPFYFDASLQSWVAASAAAVAEVLTSPLCGVRPAGQQTPATLAGTPLGDYFSRLLRQRDDAAHQPEKHALLTALQALDEADLQQHCLLAWQLEIASEPLDGARLDRLMLAYPLRVMASLLGMNEAMLTQSAAQLDALLAGLAADASPAQVEAGSVAALALQQQLAAVPPRRSALLDDLRAIWPEPASWQANAVALLQQTREATAAWLGQLLLLLARQPERRAPLHLPTSGHEAVLAESLRLAAPIQNTRRFVLTDGLLCGQTVLAGQPVLVLLAAANLDAACHHEPTRFVPERPVRQEHGFGLGAHRCPGSRLARVMATTAWHGLSSLALPWSSLLADLHFRPSGNASWPQFSPQGEQA